MMKERLTPDLERIAWEYTENCVTAYAYEGLDTLTTMRQYNDSAHGLSFTRIERPGSNLVITGLRLADDDLARVATRIDQLVRAYLQSDAYLSA